MQKTLSFALGQLGTVAKRRRVYVKDNLRIYLDEVEGIGTFVELSVRFLIVYETYNIISSFNK